MDRGVIATAAELYDARHYPSVVAMVTDALDVEPDCVDLLLIRARAHIALRRDLDAQSDLRDIIRLDPACGPAFRLLGELAARRDEHESAAIFFREALRLDPADREAAEWLAIVQSSSSRPAPVAIPAPAAVAGRFPAQASYQVTQPMRGPRPVTTRTLSSPARQRAGSQPGTQPPPRLAARGTQPPNDMLDPYEDVPTPALPTPIQTGPTQKFARGSEPPESAVWKTPAPAPHDVERKLTSPGTMMPPRRPMSSPPRPLSRGPTPELPGFGEYLVAAGILTRERLRAAQAYQRSMKVQLSTAIVTLGLATPQRIEWAAVAHQSQLARERQQQGER
nr:hypothetical protein [Kofleriaceae bacterium]